MKTGLKTSRRLLPNILDFRKICVRNTERKTYGFYDLLKLLMENRISILYRSKGFSVS